MGLDITAYSKIQKLDVPVDDDGEPLDWSGNMFVVCVNDDFGPERWAGLVDRGVYGYEEVHSFRAGSYGGYNAWRDELARIAGYPLAQYESFGMQRESHAAHAWKHPNSPLPFIELVNFSDCEGVLCAAVAAKLAKDFSEWDERMAASTVPWFKERYDEWRKALELAADGGCVCFH